MFDDPPIDTLDRLAVEREIDFFETDEPFPSLELSFDRRGVRWVGVIEGCLVWPATIRLGPGRVELPS
jgi:hypothetical protein